jgi:hypothetical protein
LPALAAAKRKAQKISCTNNLKQVGLSIRIWSGDNGDRYPMQVTWTSGGANEYVGHNGAAAKVFNPGMVFMVMSNELSTPKIVYCPSDNYHNSGAATNFTWGALLGQGSPNVGTEASAITAGQLSKISYFVCGDSVESDPQACLAGDMNIGSTGGGTGTAANGAAGWSFVTTSGAPQTPSVIANAAGPGNTFLNAAAWGQVNGAWAWTLNDFHQKTGNLGLNDGSVQGATISGLHTYLQNGTNSSSQASFNFGL